MTYRLSKSRIAAFEQCPRKLWLMTHMPHLAQPQDDAAERFAVGHAVGAEACEQCPSGVMVNAIPNLSAAIATTRALLDAGDRKPIFEATFQHHGVLVRCDILQPEGEDGWHLIEVKSSTKAKIEHLRDLATQVWVARSAGLRIARASIRHLNSEFVLRRAGDYSGLFRDTELLAEIEPLIADRPVVVGSAMTMLCEAEPVCATGRHCKAPYPCDFQGYCRSQEPDQPEWPVTILVHRGADAFVQKGVTDLMAVEPSQIASPVNRRIHRATITGTLEHDVIGAAAAMAAWAYPRIWLDFETISDAIPRWTDCWPYRQAAFQFSALIEADDGSITPHAFLSFDGDPRRACAEALARLPTEGAVIAWNAEFERKRLIELAQDFPDLRVLLHSLADRTVDLLPVAKAHWYHRDQRGSWSIKAVLPTIAPDLSYDDLTVANGGDAQTAYRRAIRPETSESERREIARALLEYCERDTEAMMVIAQRLGGKG